MRFFVIALATVGLAGTGCYSYVPASVDEVPVGSDIRAHLSRSGIERFQQLGVASEAIDGRLAASDSTGLVVETQAWSSTTMLYGQRPVRQPVDLTPQDVTAVSVRRLDRTKTWAATGVAAGAGVALFVTIARGFFGGDNDGGDEKITDPEELRVPIRIPVGW